MERDSVSECIRDDIAGTQCSSKKSWVEWTDLTGVSAVRKTGKVPSARRTGT